MRELTIKGKSGISRILIGERIQNCGDYVPPDKTIIITDTTVASLYRKHFPSEKVIVIDVGEKIKNLETVTKIYGALLEMEADRSCFILGVGGGTSDATIEYVGVEFDLSPGTIIYLSFG